MANAFSPLFDVQRTALKQTQKATIDAVKAQQESFNVVTQAMQSGQDLAERNNEFSRNSWHAYLDAVEASLPEGAANFEEFHRTVDEGHDAYFESESEAVEAFIEAVEEGGDAYEEFTENYAEMVDSSFESMMESYDGLEESFEDVEIPTSAD